MDVHSRKVSLSITRWRHGRDPVERKRICTTLDSLEQTYIKHVPPGSLSVLEASGNSFSVAGRLRAAGYKVEVLASDTLSGMSRADRVNDRIDAYNLSRAYARGIVRKVDVPDQVHLEWRDLWFGYRNAVKDCTRLSNRIWGYCSGHGFKLPSRSRTSKITSIRAEAARRGWSATALFNLEMLIGQYSNSLELRDRYQSQIEQTVAGNSDMTRLMQILGIRFVTAFALAAFIGDISRFPSSGKLVSYIGLNPRIEDSGEHKSRRTVSSFGRSDLKALMIEAAQSSLRTGSEPMHKWARHLAASCKHRNVVVCALARKMVCYVWHILMKHPAPATQPSDSFKRKLFKLAGRLGKEKLRELGYTSSAEYVEAVCAQGMPAAAACAALPGRSPARERARVPCKGRSAGTCKKPNPQSAKRHKL